MSKTEFYRLLDDINATDTDFGRRMEFARLVIEYVRGAGGIVNDKE